MKNTIESTDHGAFGMEAQCPRGSSQVANTILLTTHTLAFLPLFLIVALQDVHLKLAVVLNATVMVLLAIGNFVFYRLQVVKVYPKLLDTLLLIFYASMIPVVYLQHDWLQYWVCVFHHSIVAGFMWLSILLPVWDDFTLESLKDRLPAQLWQQQPAQRTALHASQAWAGALTLMALAALGPTLSGQNQVWSLVHIMCNYVLGFLPLLVAAVVQHWVLHRGTAAVHLWQLQADAEAGVSVMEPPSLSGPSSKPSALCSRAGLSTQSSQASGADTAGCSSSNASSSTGAGAVDDVEAARDRLCGAAKQAGQALKQGTVSPGTPVDF